MIMFKMATTHVFGQKIVAILREKSHDLLTKTADRSAIVLRNIQPFGIIMV